MTLRPPLIIGVAGYKQSGKDTLAGRLCSHHGYTKISFAHPLKKLCSELLDIDMRVFEDGMLKETIDPRYNMTPREMLIKVGTECFRDIRDDVWVACAMKETKRTPYNVVISDVRFQNEADEVIARGGALIRVVRKGYDKGADIGDIDWSATAHYRVDNDGDIEALRNKMDALLREVTR